jgi:ubiquinone/menaquinone biosynthesis C-methylase UbiE
MRRSIFPKKFGASMETHREILASILGDAHGKRVLEISTGSGSIAKFLSPDNAFVGTDISPGLLRRAVKKLQGAGFSDTSFYVVPAENLPFEDRAFDLVLCVLALNFFADADRVLDEVKRVLAPGGALVCAVPVPERKKTSSPIRGTLRSEDELKPLLNRHGFGFEPVPAENGCLLYFKSPVLTQ